MAETTLLVTQVTTAELATLVSTNALVEGCQYKNTQTGILYLALSANTYKSVFQYKSYIASIAARFLNNSLGDIALVEGETYVIFSIQGDDNFSNLGYVEPGTPFIATGTTPTAWEDGTSVYCLTDEPFNVTILENTLGDIVWTRGSTGWYDGTLTGAFTAKTVTPPFAGLTNMPIANQNDDAAAYYYQVVTSEINAVGIAVVNKAYVPTDLCAACNDQPIYVEIRVYD